MTERVRRNLNLSFAVIALTIAFIVAMVMVFKIGVAWASSSDVTPSDPSDLIQQAYEFMRTGRGTAAVGVFSMLVVWVLRLKILKQVEFFQTMIGGYVLGFTVPTLQYLGGALVSENSITVSLFINAIGAGFVAAGGWEALRDVITKARARALVADALKEEKK